MERSRVVVTKAGVNSSGSIFDQKRCAIFLRGDSSNACFSSASYLRPPPHHQHIIGQQQHHLVVGGGGGGSTALNGRSSTEINIFDAHKYFNELCITNDTQKDVVVCGDHDQCEDVSTVFPSRSSWASSSVADHQSSYSSIGRNVYRARSFHVATATPTASSEASWNSQTGLLSNPPGTTHLHHHHHNHHHNHGDQKKNKIGRRWCGLFPRRCPCSGNRSVQVEDQKSTTQPPAAKGDMNNKKETTSFSLAAAPHDQYVWTAKEPQVRTTSTPGFSFPILKLNGSTTTSSATTKLHDLKRQVIKSPRDSLEVFGRPFVMSNEKSSTISSRIQKSSTSTTDHFTAGFTLPSSSLPKIANNNNNNNNNIEDDVASDASSDLFEIETFPSSKIRESMLLYEYSRRSRGNNSVDDENMIRRFNVDDDDEPNNSTPAWMSTEYCYEPSEASVDWSVTTANAASESAAEHEQHDELENMSKPKYSYSGNYGLLSCRGEKAVSVGPNPVKLIMPAAERHHAVGPPPSIVHIEASPCGE